VICVFFSGVLVYLIALTFFFFFWENARFYWQLDWPESEPFMCIFFGSYDIIHIFYFILQACFPVSILFQFHE